MSHPNWPPRAGRSQAERPFHVGKSYPIRGRHVEACDRILPCCCSDDEADQEHGLHLRLFSWFGSRARLEFPELPLNRKPGWRCTSCGRRKPGSVEGDLA